MPGALTRSASRRPAPERFPRPQGLVPLYPRPQGLGDQPARAAGQLWGTMNFSRLAASCSNAFEL